MIKDETALRKLSINLPALMKKREMSQAELARHTGESDARIANYKFGRVLPSLAVAARIAEALDCTIDELLK